MQKFLPENVEDVLGLTPMQEGILFHSLASDLPNIYFNQLRIFVKGAVEKSIFEKTWSDIIFRNPMLRTVFKWEKLSKPVQIVLKDFQPSISYYDLSILPIEDKCSQIECIIEKDQKLEFELGNYPYRVLLFKIDDFNYELVISNHHIIYDGWSTGILLNDFFTTYNSFSKNTPSFNNSIKGTYKEYIVWLENTLENDSLSKDFWTQYLKDFSTIITFPFKKNHELNNSFGFKIFSQELSDVFTNKIKLFCKDNKITEATFFYSIWAILLKKILNSNDVIFGTTISGRSPGIKNIESIIGLFIHTLPLRIKADNMLVIEFMRQLQENTINRDQYYYTPLVKIKECSEFDKFSELFNTLVVIENYPVNRNVLNNENLIYLEKYSNFENNHFDLSLVVKAFDSYFIEFQYWNNLYSQEDISSLCKNFINIVDYILQHPHTLVDEVEILDPIDKEELVVGFNNTQVDLTSDLKLIDRFIENVNLHPHKVAIVASNHYITYKCLKDEVDRVAYYLNNLLQGKNNIILIYLQQSPYYIISILSILKSGNIYLPLDVDCPEERLHYIVNDIQADVIITDKISKKEFSSVFGQKIIIDISEIVEQENEAKQDINVSGSFMYTIYTSGSTGKPKGVLISNENVLNFFIGVNNALNFPKELRMLAITSFSFDIFILETLFPLFYGGTTIIATDSERKDPNKIIALISKFNINTVQVTPSRLYLLLLTENFQEACKSLDLLLIGGEPLPENIFRKVKEVYHKEIYNLYGPTETTVWSTIANLTEVDEVTLGRPIANTQIYIVGKTMKIIPPGITGEILIAGEGLAEGYINKPEHTCERFTENIFNKGSQLYHTGDLGCWLPDGKIKFLGRFDNQVKLNGYRIELEEIEYNVLKFDGIDRCAVLIQEYKDGTKYLCVYYCSKNDIKSSDLKEYLATLLPKYMVPSYFCRLNELPYTDSGKINRKALPLIEVEKTKNFTAPSTQTENQIVNILADILNLDKNRIGVEDDFLKLGGNSIKAFVFASKLQKTFDFMMPLSVIMNGANIKDIADMVHLNAKRNTTVVHKVKNEKDYYPLSVQQIGIYFQQQLFPESIKFNMPALFSIQGSVDIRKLENAFIRLISENSVLRTSFEWLDNMAVQKIYDNVDFNLQQIYSSEQDLNETITRTVKAFFLSKPPLIKAFLIHYSNDKFLLMIDIHHIICDGFSQTFLVKQFNKIYKGLEVEKIDYQYQDYVNWQKSFKQSDNYKEQENYWLKEFQSVPSFVTFPKFNIPKGASCRNVHFSIDKGKLLVLRNINISQKVTMSTMLITFYYIFLSKLSTLKDIVIGVPVLGRKEQEFQNMIGLFINVLCIKCSVEQSLTFMQFQNCVKDKIFKSLDNQDYLYEDLVKQLGNKMKLNRPVYNVSFIFQNFEMPYLIMDGLKVQSYDFLESTSKNHLDLMAEEKEDGIYFTFRYNDTLFDEPAIQNLSNFFLSIVDKVVGNQNIKISDIDSYQTANQCYINSFNDDLESE